MTTLEQVLLRIHHNLQILQEREAKQGSSPDLKLLNEIEDHQKAIELIEQALSSELTETGLEELKEVLRPLLVASNVESINVDELKPELPLLPFEPETILIPAGPFLMGSESGEGVSKWETPQHEVTLLDYKIGKYPITNEQYAEFTRQTGRLVSPEAGWEGQKPADDKLNHPVMGITWYDALAYCEWLTGQTNGQRQYMLPSEAQWEKAARSTDGRTFPWGNEWDASRCNHGSDDTQPVDAYGPQSEFGCYDMTGNVREWTTTLWGKRMVTPDPEFRYPWVDDHRRDNLLAKNHIFRVYRGGAYSDNVTQLRCSARAGLDPRKTGERGKRHGLRVVLKA